MCSVEGERGVKAGCGWDMFCLCLVLVLLICLHAVCIKFRVGLHHLIQLCRCRHSGCLADRCPSLLGNAIPALLLLFAGMWQQTIAALLCSSLKIILLVLFDITSYFIYSGLWGDILLFQELSLAAVLFDSPLASFSVCSVSAVVLHEVVHL